MPAGEINRLADHLFRQESGKLVSVLTGLFGIERLQMAEDVVQEALIKALQTWPYYGIPKNPAAWLTQTAKNLALDIIRREQNFNQKQTQIISFMEGWSEEGDPADSAAFENEIKDDRLRLMFACCHPQIAQESQTALALKTLCGFGPAEIAKAFLTTEAAIAKRLTRARQSIQEKRIPFEIPAGQDAAVRLDGVLHTVYLLFNEGYKASHGESLIREELCTEAIRLGMLLAEHPLTNQPRVHALLALMLFNAARLETRTDAEGNLLLLKDQDRSRWNKGMIARGLWHLGHSATGSDLSQYHLQAGIAACHCMASSYEATDWPQILSLYDRLIEIDHSPIVGLNRAIAVAQVAGPQAGIKAIESIGNRSALDSYYLLHAVLAEFQASLEDYEAALKHLERALELADLKSEQVLLTKRIRDCVERASKS